MNGDDSITTITHAGLIFLVYLFVMVAFYFLLSTPVDAIFDAFTGSHFGYANEEMALFVPYFRTAVKMAFAIGITTPIVWFIFWGFSREPAHSRIRLR